MNPNDKLLGILTRKMILKLFTRICVAQLFDKAIPDTPPNHIVAKRDSDKCEIESHHSDESMNIRATRILLRKFPLHAAGPSTRFLLSSVGTFRWNFY